MLLLFGPQSGVQPSTGADAKTTVLIGFDTAPGVDPPTWTDVSAYLVEGNVSRGRQQELDDYQAGTATVVLRNEDRRFDPEYSAGPHFGKVLPMKRLRVAAEYNGTTYTLFDGFIDSWDQTYGDAANNFAEAVVTATDGFKVLSVANLPTSAYAQEVIADGPTHWWRLGEPAGSATLFDSRGSAHLTVAGSPTLGETSLIAREANTAMKPTTTSVFAGTATNGTPPGTGPFAVEAAYRDDGTVGTSTLFRMFLAEQSELSLSVSAAGTITGSLATAGVSVTSTDTTAGNGAIHHIVFSRNATGDLQIWLDGVDVTFTPANSSYDVTSTSVGVGASVNATIDEIAFYNTALSAARIIAHSDQVATPWNGDTPKARMDRILDAVDWPSTLRELDTGSSILQSADLADTTALDHAKKVNQSEFGNLYMTADGKVRLEGRNAAVNQTSLGTFGDNPGELGYMELEYDFSDQLIRNDVTVSRNEGVAQNVQDSASIGSFLRHSFTRDGLIHNSDTVSLNAAQFYVSEYKDPLLRVTGMTLNPRGSGTTLFPQALARELTDRITVRRRPQGVGSVIEQFTVIEGIKHDFGPKRWSTTWSLSPAFGDAVGNFWQIGVVGSSELGTTNRLYF